MPLLMYLPLLAYPPLTELFHELDTRLPHGFYRIPSLVATPNGSLLAFVMGRLQRTDLTPNIVYMRRSVDDGATWAPAVPLLQDPTNRTEYDGAPVVDPTTGTIHYMHQQMVFGSRNCSACVLWQCSSTE